MIIWLYKEVKILLKYASKAHAWRAFLVIASKQFKKNTPFLVALFNVHKKYQ